MKKMKTKRLFAVLLTLAMVLGMTAVSVADPENVITASAERKELSGVDRSDADQAPVSVYNVVSGAAVTAYRVVKPVYENERFVGYDAIAVNEQKINPVSPSALDVTAVAAEIAKLNYDKDLLMGLGVTSSALSTNGNLNSEGLLDYTGYLSPGYWIVLVTNSGDTIYNPMLLGVYYQTTNSDGTINTVSGGAVDATSDWSLTAQDVYAKSAEPEFEKKIIESSTIDDTGDPQNNTDTDKLSGNKNSGNDVAIGDIVKFEIKAQIPEYSPVYTDVFVSISDSVSGSGLTVNKNSIQVYVGATSEAAFSADPVEAGPDTYTLTPEESVEIKEFTIDFASSYALSHPGDYVFVRYEAVLGEDANINQIPNTNNAKFTYTNDPSDKNKTKTQEKETHTYTFAIDANVEGGFIRDVVKYGEVVSGGSIENVPLSGAGFKLVTSGSAFTKTYNATSGALGQIQFTGLDAGSYYLQETVAPAGYSLNDAIIPVDIIAEYNEDGTLKKYEITINGNITSTYNVELQTDTNFAGGVNEDPYPEHEILNTKLSELPSTGGIGTTIFTIAGCLIMILAAALFFASRRKSSKK